MNRYADVDYDNKKLPPVYGYWYHPIWSFEQTMQPIKSQINNLDQFAKVAKEHCHFPSEHGLTHDESAAVYLYTMEWGDASLYRVLNRVLRSVDRQTVKPWFAFLRLFDSALEKLPVVKKSVWRGVPEDISKRFKENEVITGWGISSCSSTVNVIKQFLRENSTLFLIETVNGRSLRGYTS
jgi:NAD:arginine ADP-ribosyltransferase